ncbi:MAG: glycosyltransferase [Pseudomonadota bacterium]|nr:glycosyltransferase [Pseudomonadota bacterium]
MRIAIVHDWLDTWGGSENVLAALLDLYPAADLYAVVDFLSEADRARLRGRMIRTSFIQHLPFARGHFRKYLPLMPRAVERFDLSGYDMIISSSHAASKGVLTGKDQFHVCICYSPARYAWEFEHQYLADAGLDRWPLARLTRRAMRRFREWDFNAAQRVDRFVAISGYIARRIERCYGRSAEVIYPPVDVARYSNAAAERAPFYLTLSRLVPYKRVDLIVAAFAGMPARQLIVAGDGPDLREIAATAPANVRVLGQVTDVERDRLLSTTRAFVFAAEEDFGIAPLEAQACGTPVIAFAKGGAVETVQGLDAAAPTGVFFDEQTSAAIRDAVIRFERSSQRITAEACRANAQRFDISVFRKRFGDFVAAAFAEFRAARVARSSTC